jgi:hypothetical protein
MEKVITEVGGYKVYASIEEIQGQRGMYSLAFSSGLVTAKDPDARQVKFQTFLTWSQLKELKALLP